MIFYGAELSQDETLKEVLYKYELAFGQMINCSKTDVVFSKGIPENHRNQISLCLDIHEVLSHDKYLGAPTFMGHSIKEEAFPLSGGLNQEVLIRAHG